MTSFLSSFFWELVVYLLLHCYNSFYRAEYLSDLQPNAMAEVAIPADHVGDVSLDIRWLSG